MLTLTQHFEACWLERVGNWPTPEAVAQYIAQSVQVQRTEDFKRADGRPYRILSIFWHPELDLIMKIDEFDNAAVTVISRPQYRKRPIAEQPAPAPDSAALSERIARLRAVFGHTKPRRAGLRPPRAASTR